MRDCDEEKKKARQNETEIGSVGIMAAADGVEEQRRSDTGKWNEEQWEWVVEEGERTCV